MTLGYLLKRYRKERGFSQRTLAAKAHVRQALISDLETGKKQDTLSRTLQRLAQALDVTLGDLLGQDSRPDRSACPHPPRLWKVAASGG